MTIFDHLRQPSRAKRTRRLTNFGMSQVCKRIFGSTAWAAELQASNP